MAGAATGQGLCGMRKPIPRPVNMLGRPGTRSFQPARPLGPTPGMLGCQPEADGDRRFFVMSTGQTIGPQARLRLCPWLSAELRVMVRLALARIHVRLKAAEDRTRRLSLSVCREMNRHGGWVRVTGIQPKVTNSTVTEDLFPPCSQPRVSGPGKAVAAMVWSEG